MNAQAREMVGKTYDKNLDISVGARAPRCQDKHWMTESSYFDAWYRLGFGIRRQPEYSARRRLDVVNGGWWHGSSRAVHFAMNDAGTLLLRGYRYGCVLCE